MAKRRAIPKAVRDKLLVEAMHRCCLCPEHADITAVHHIHPISEGGANNEDNLIVVCPNCHDKIHRIRNRYTPEQLRMYKERWVQLCALGLTIEQRVKLAFDYNRLPMPRNAGNLDARILQILYDYLQEHLGDPKMSLNELVGTVWAEKSNVIQCLMGLQEKAWLDYDLTEGAEGGVVWLTQLGIRVAEDASGD